jgi:hypothetical protein
VLVASIQSPAGGSEEAVRMHPDQRVPVNGSWTLPTRTVGASTELEGENADLLANERMRNRRVPSACHGAEGTNR